MTSSSSHTFEKASETAATLALEVSGMKCAGCVRAVERRLLQQTGVETATVNLVTTVAAIEYWPQQIDGEQLADRLTQSLTDIGFPAQRRDASPSINREIANSPLKQQRGQLLLSALLILCSSLGHLAPALGWQPPLLENMGLHWGLATITLWLCRDILLNGIQGLRHGIPNMNTLVGLGSLSAYTASLVALLWPQLGWECFFDEPVMLLGFILLGRTLEQQAKHQASEALRSLLTLRPDQAQVLIPPTLSDTGESQDPLAVDLLNGKVMSIPAERLRVGEQIRVLPSERIPADGRVIAGQSTIDESMLTGEFAPVTKEIGAGVSAGSLNLSAPIVIEVTQTGADTTLARMIELVETAQTRKAPIQRLVDQVAGYFTYGVMAVALLTFGFWYGWGTHHWPMVLEQGAGWMTGMHHSGVQHAMAGMDPMASPMATTTPLLLSLKLAIAVLVVACPCSLGLATPTALLVGSGLGAEQGLLIRGGDVLEKVHRVDTCVLDKTGTVTTGTPQVTDIWCTPQASAELDGAPEESEVELLQWAASLEAGTRHPLGKAILQTAETRGITLLPTQDSQTQAGLGVTAWIDGKMACLGNRPWMESQAVDLPTHANQEAEQWAKQGKTVVYMAREGQLLGLMALADTPRPDAAQTIAHLKARGLAIHLLTGDRRTTAEAMAKSLDIPAERVLAEVRPEGKAAAIAQLQEQGARVVMVGDGINDAPALAQANVGISLRSGTEVAMETAEIVLMSDRLQDVLTAIQLSEATLQKIRQNLVWAFAYNLVAIPLAAGLLLPKWGLAFSPALAGALMALSSVAVVTNSLMLRWSRGWHTLHAAPL